MIIYYHCTRDSALLLSFLLTCHPPLSFHEMIFILVPPVLFRANARCMFHSSRARNSATKNVITADIIPRIAHAQQKINHAYLCQWRLV